MSEQKEIYLRPLQKADAESLWELRRYNREFFRPFEPVRSEADFTLEAQQSAIEQSQADSDTDRAYIFGMFRTADHRLVGRISITGVVRAAWQNANVGYYVDCRYNGKGYATEAVRQAVKFAFMEAKLHRVQAAVMPRNIASCRVLEKAGFRKEGLALRYLNINGVWEDHYIYAITSEDLTGVDV